MKTVLDLVGHTPLVQFSERTFVKCEFGNPSGSIKARMVKYIIEKAESEGLITPDTILVEATSGNTGNALSMIAAAKGYRCLILMPEGYTQERIGICRSYGAELRLVGTFHLNEAIEEAKAIRQQPGYWSLNQFDNEWNIEENEIVLGKEILQQIPKGVQIDAIVQGVGTGGTIIGVGRAIRNHHNKDCKIFAVEPEESKTLLENQTGVHQIEGIADGFVPQIIERNRAMIDDVIPVCSRDAIRMMRRLGRENGFLVGSSSGANLLAVERIRRTYPEVGNILTFFCDEGEKYLSRYHMM